MQEEISPWSIYDKGFNKEKNPKSKEETKTLDVSAKT